MSTHLQLLRNHLKLQIFPKELIALISSYFANEICLIVEILDAFRAGNSQMLTWLFTFVAIQHAVTPDREAKVNAEITRRQPKDMSNHRYIAYDNTYHIFADRDISYGHLLFVFTNTQRYFSIKDEILTCALSVAPYLNIIKILDFLQKHNIDFRPAMERYRVKWENDTMYQKLVTYKPEILKLTPVIYEPDFHDESLPSLNTLDNYAGVVLYWNLSHLNHFPIAFRTLAHDPKIRESIYPMTKGDGGFLVREIKDANNLVGMYHLCYELSEGN